MIYIFYNILSHSLRHRTILSHLFKNCFLQFFHRHIFIRFVPVYDYLFGLLFFLLLFIAAVTSALSQVQPAVAFVEEYWNLRRGQSIALVAGLLLVGAIAIIWYTEGLLALDSIDFWVGSLILYITTGINLIFFNHIWGTENGMTELKNGARIRIPRCAAFIIRRVTPLIMLTIFTAWVYQELFVTRSSYVANIAEGKIGAILPLVWAVGITVFFCIVAATSRRFNKQ